MMTRDIRYAIRQLRKSPGFALTAVLTLAFGIGATTAIFSVVEGVLLRPLPFPHSQALMAAGDELEGAPFAGGPSVPAAEMLQYMRDTRAFSAMGGYRETNYELSGAGEPAQVNASRMTASMFPTLGVSPALGRVFTQEEDQGRAQVAVISYQTWRSRFHGEAGILGRRIQLDRKPYEIVGVMPRDFEFPLVPGQLNRSELWVPTSLTQDELSSGQGSWNYRMVGRLRPGITAVRAQADMQRVAEDIMRNFPAPMQTLKLHAVVVSLNEKTVSEARPLVRTLFLAVVVVLFIGCANLAGLLLVRVIQRRREVSVRLALGASVREVVLQNLIEVLVLSISGGLAGLALAWVAVRAGVSMLPETLPRIDSISLDWKVVSFALLLAVITGLACGMIPALAASRTKVNDALKEGGRTGTAGGHARLRSALVITELAVALVLLSGAGLLLKSFEKLRAVNLGFRTDHMLTAYYSLPHQQYSTQASVDAFNRVLQAKLAQLPGVDAVGLTSNLPASGNTDNSGIVAEGYVPIKGKTLNLSWPSQITGDYFGAAGIPIVRGRSFTQADGAGTPLVVIVNRTLAERYWPGQDPVGKRIHLGVPEIPLPWMTVVGEIGDIKQTTADSETQAQIYQPAGQFKETLGMFAQQSMLNGDSGSIVLRTGLAPEQMADSLRAVVRSIDPQLPLTQVQSMDRVVSEGQAPRRFNAALISAFAAAALLLALLGIYSVIAFSTAMRTQEMAIRLALGSQRAGLMRLILASGAKLGIVGAGIGAVGAVFAMRLMRALLFEVDPLDPVVLVVAALSILLLALAASYIPARRAAAIEPMQALRTE
ncbi:MAG TPA: ABC transporter permease [Terracidiphilus sp.]